MTIMKKYQKDYRCIWRIKLCTKQFSNDIMKHFQTESNIQMCEKATVGIHSNSEMAKTGLNVTANSDIRQRRDACG